MDLAYSLCRIFFALLFIGIIAGCATPSTPVGPSPEMIARQQRVERAEKSLDEGIKKYDVGAYDESMKSLLVALDSGVLTIPQQLNARKHIAFIHCVNNKELICKEEFEKAFALDPKFELAAAEAGHPTWGPIYRLVKTEIEIRRSGKSLPVDTPKSLSVAEKLFADATKAYDDADYAKSVKGFQESAREATSLSERVRALKFAAFSLCLAGRGPLCRAEFEKILALDATFELAPAEAGHPSWGPSFKTVKAKQAAAKK